MSERRGVVVDGQGAACSACNGSVGGNGTHEFDLIVLGGGSAGFAAAIRGADLGARVAMVNDGILGGTCVNVGCVPSKTLIRAAEANHRLAHHGFAGVPRPGGTPDWDAVRRQKDELVSELRQTKYRDVLGAHDGITLFEARGTVAPAGAVILSDRSTLRAEKLVVTTGSSPWIAPIPGLAESGYLDSTTAMDLPVLPRSMAVIGGGYVGLELGQMFARLGVRVTLLARHAPILRHEDPAIGTALAGYLTDEGVDVRTGATVERVERSEGYRIHFLQEGEPRVVTADQLLVATGRRGNTRRFGLEQAGVRLGSKGEVVVDEYLRTSVPGIYAAGDATGEPMYVYVAAHAGALAVENALTGDARPIDLAAVPRVTFTDPSVASVGLTEYESRSGGIETLTSVLPLGHVPRALAARDTRGFIKLVADAETRRLLGAQILAAQTFDKELDKLSCCAA